MEALRDGGADVKGMVAIFTYGFKVAEDRFKEADVRLFTLSDYNMLIDQAATSGYVKDEDIQSLQVWRQNPAEWGKG